MFKSKNGETRWRIRGFVSANSKIDYAELLPTIERGLISLLVDRHGEPIPGVRIETTGVMPLVHRIQHQLMDDLQNSFLMAFGIILMVMTVMQGGIVVGVIAMIPNIFPSLLLFGFLGWTDVAVDIGSVMTASVALGVAVDDTLHFLVSFQRSLQAGKSRKASVLFAYQHCGTAMLQTSATCAAGMAVFALSDFVPTARFAWMMIGLFVAAIVGDMILLPALLLGPLGRLFEFPSTSSDPSEAVALPVAPNPRPPEQPDQSQRSSSGLRRLMVR